ncbi:hypothetical protein THAOC_20776 [Thalassiosira oceanica]|uniref:Uncharacterized protein n=1 Tax=Thalassiosira oceanica TaxID=159749 RepID=K0RZ15_THAOC|nr:hypothetical protein THAOC_20776 [Thalassiosira oceanica]|eukprot:EJK59053.1 hypothetical protein THAOC_20776 [Thalassiosira oceanica]
MPIQCRISIANNAPKLLRSFAQEPRSKPRPAAEEIIDLSRDSGDENEKPAAEEAEEHPFIDENENLAAGESQASYWQAGARTTAKPEQAARKRRHEQDDVIELSSDEESVEESVDFGDKKPAAKPGKSEGDEEDEEEDDDDEDDDLADGDLLLNLEDYGDYDPARPPADDPTFDTEEEYVDHYEARHGGAVLSFGGTRRAGLNAAQKEQLGRFLAGGRRLYDILREANCVFLPCGRYDGCFDQDNMDGNPFVYGVKQKSKKKSTKRRKTAADDGGDGGEDARKGGLVLPRRQKTQRVREDVERHVGGRGAHDQHERRTDSCAASADRQPAEYHDAARPRHATDQARRGGHRQGRPSRLHRTHRVNGLMIRSILNNTESAVQVALGDDERLEVDPFTAPHEYATSRMGLRYLSEDRRVVAGAQAFFDAFGVSDRRQMRPHITVVAVSTWAPGIMESMESVEDYEGTALTVVILDEMVGKKNWEDSMKYPPTHDKKPERRAQCYDTSLYSDGDWLLSAANKFHKLLAVELIGGIILFDSDNELMANLHRIAPDQYPRGLTMAGDILRRRPFGEDGPRWELWDKADTFGNIVLKLESSTDDRLRLAIVHGAPCHPLNWNPDEPSPGWDEFRRRESAAMGLQFLNLIVKVFREENASLVLDKSLDAPIAGSILFGWYLAVDWALSHHMAMFACVLAFKNFMIGESRNLNEPGNSGLILKTADVFGSHARSQLNDPKKAKGGKDSKGTLRPRSTDATTLLGSLRGELRAAFAATCEALSNNRGWRGKGRVVVTSGQCEANDLNLAEIIWNHLQVWVVTEHGATPPEDGTLITNKHNAAGKYYWKDCEEEDEATEFRYSHDESLDGMTLLGVVNRTTGQNLGSKTTQKFKGIPFVDYRVVQPFNQRVNGGHRTKMSNPNGSGKSKFQTDQNGDQDQVGLDKGWNRGGPTSRARRAPGRARVQVLPRRGGGVGRLEDYLSIRSKVQQSL